MSLAQLILSGVFDRLPDLKIFFAETRLGWVPFWMEEADYWYERHRHWAERLLGFKPLEAPAERVRAASTSSSACSTSSAWPSSCATTWAWTTSCSPPTSRTSSATGRTRGPFAERLFAGVPADEAFKIAAGNMLGVLPPAGHARWGAPSWPSAHDAALRPEPLRLPLGGGVRRRRARGPRRSAGTRRSSPTPSSAAATPTCCWRRPLRPPSASCWGRCSPIRSTAIPPSPRRRSRRSTSWRRGGCCSAGASATPRCGWPGCGRRGSTELEDGTRLMRALLDGEAVEVGAARPARLPHHRPVPIWIAAGGPRTLRMAGGVADGVFIRVGTHPANIEDLGRRDPRRRRRGRARSGRGAGRRDLPHRARWTIRRAR